MEGTGPKVQATETSFGVIEALNAEPGLGVTDIARALDLSKSAVHKHLQTLLNLGYVVREGNEYYLSNRFTRLASTAGSRYPLEAATDVVEGLAETTGHRSNFIVHENTCGVYAIIADPGTPATGSPEEGDIAPLHATAGGKAILSFIASEERDDLIGAAELESYTEKTITGRARLDTELNSVRDQRLAFDREEYMDGHQCVASPVLDADGDPVGAVSVTGAIRQMSGKRLEEDVTGHVSTAAKSLEKEILSS